MSGGTQGGLCLLDYELKHSSNYSAAPTLYDAPGGQHASTTITLEAMGEWRRTYQTQQTINYYSVWASITVSASSYVAVRTQGANSDPDDTDTDTASAGYSVTNK